MTESLPPVQLNDKKQQILHAAVHLLAQYGFQGFSMQKLANDAGVAAGTIYRYFNDKEHLIEEVRIGVLQRIADTIQQGVEDHLPLKERFTLIWRNVGSLVDSDVDIIMNRFQYECMPQCTPHDQDAVRKMFSKVDLLFTQGKQIGLFKPLDNQILISLSLDVSMALARKHAQSRYIVTEHALEQAIEASWDAVIQH